MCAKQKLWWRWVAGVAGLLFTPIALAQSGITNEGAYTVLRTASNGPVVSFTNQPELPALGVIPTISFEFGFATQETNFLETFFDSFSLTLQSSTNVTTVLTADLAGVAWAPRTPGGVELNTNGMLINSNTFPNFASIPSLRFAYTVSLFLPLPLSTGPLDVILDLFDNLNQFASMAYISGLRLDATGSTSTKARFYRLGSTVRTRIDSLQEDGSSLLLNYHFQPQVLELHSAPEVSGPYTRVTNGILRAVEQVFAVGRPNTNQFFRILSDTNATIVSVRVSGMLLLVEFDFETNVAPVQVESALTIATNVTNRFFERPATRSEPPRRKLRVAKPGLPLPAP